MRFRSWFSFCVVPLLIAVGLHAAALLEAAGRDDIAVGATRAAPTVSEEAVTVRDWDALSDAVAVGAPEVFIPDDVSIDVPNRARALQLAAGQRLVGTRSLNALGGALRIPFRAGVNDYPVIRMGAGSAIEGLRILGPNAGYETENTTIGIQTVPGSTGTVIRDDELAGWSWAAVSIKQSEDVLVDHNYIHDNVRKERGYGVVVQNGDATALIRNNVFNRNRHAIAGSGQPGEGYTAGHNLIRQDGDRTAYHQFDMHQSAEGIGGAYVHIRGNVFDYGRYGTANRSSINIRGVPTSGPASITGNTFTQGWTVGSQTAVTGASGAIATPSVLQQENVFDQRIAYVRTASGCTATTAEVRMIGPCQALS